jgi:hypothetical protein
MLGDVEPERAKRRGAALTGGRDRRASGRARLRRDGFEQGAIDRRAGG